MALPMHLRVTMRIRLVIAWVIIAALGLGASSPLPLLAQNGGYYCETVCA